MASDNKWYQNGNTTPVRFNLETDTYENEDTCGCGDVLDGRRFYGYCPEDKLMRNFCFACYSTLEEVPTFTFGKYKGKPYDEVLAQDPGYFQWLWTKHLDTTATFKVDQTILDFIEENREKVDASKKTQVYQSQHECTEEWYQTFRIPFGKHNGKRMINLEQSYLRWLSGTEIKRQDVADWVGMWRLKRAEEEQSSDSDSDSD